MTKQKTVQKTKKTSRMKLAIQLMSILMRLIPEVRQIALGIKSVQKTVKKRITGKKKRKMSPKQKANARKMIRANPNMSAATKRKAIAKLK